MRIWIGLLLLFYPAFVQAECVSTPAIGPIERFLFAELCPLQVGLPDIIDPGAKGFCTREDAPSSSRNLGKVCGNSRIIERCMAGFGFEYGDHESENRFIAFLEGQCRSKALYAGRLCGGLKQVDYGQCSYECEYSDLSSDCARCVRNPVGRL